MTVTGNGKDYSSDSGDGSGDEKTDSLRPRAFNACFSSSSSAAAATTAASPVPARPKMRWGLWSSHDKSWMKLVQQNYETHHRKPRPSAVAPGDCIPPLIPFTIHHIWLGSPLPEPLTRLRESWLSRHAHASSRHAGPIQESEGEGCEVGAGEWEMRLWTDADVEAFGLENKEAYEAAGNFGQKSDILRYEILLRHGGLYVDVDFLCLASFEDLHRRYDFYTGLSNTGTFELNNGLVGCRPGHPIMRDIVNRIRDTCSPPCRPPPPLPPSSSCSPPAKAKAEAKAAAEGEGTDCNGLSGGGPVVVGDALSALVGALGGVGGATGAGAGAGAGGGLLAGLLGGEDRARLEQAVTVEPGSATETIVKTGPGVLTRAVMAWMTASAAEEGGIGTNGNSQECVLGSTGTGPAVMMILPPAYLYPIPNNAVAATEGSLIGDGMETGVRERAGGFFSAESLAAHLWGRSWQGQNGKPKS